MTDKILTFTLSNGDVVEYSESEICDVIEKLESIKIVIDKQKFNTNDIELLRETIKEILED